MLLGFLSPPECGPVFSCDATRYNLNATKAQIARGHPIQHRQPSKHTGTVTHLITILRYLRCFRMGFMGSMANRSLVADLRRFRTQEDVSGKSVNQSFPIKPGASDFCLLACSALSRLALTHCNRHHLNNHCGFALSASPATTQVPIQGLGIKVRDRRTEKCCK